MCLCVCVCVCDNTNSKCYSQVVSYYDDRTERITRKQSSSCVTDVLLVCIYLEIYHSPKLLWS